MNALPHEESGGDEELVRRFQKGDENAFDSLVLKYKQRVFGLCFRFMKQADEAHDLAQDVFLKVYHGLAKFNSDSKFSTWLYRVCANTCLNKLNSASHRKETVLVDYHHSIEGPKPEADLENKRLKSNIQNCLEKLSIDHRSVVVLRDVDGMAYEEVAQVLNQNLGTVKSQLARARSLMRKCLEFTL